MTSITQTGPSKAIRGAFIAMAAVVGFTAFGASPAEASPHARCVAVAKTFKGATIQNTRAVSERGRIAGACKVALYKCEAKLDRRRHAIGKPLRRAQCEVVRKARLDRGHHGGKFYGYVERRPLAQSRCVAEAFSFRGRPLSKTRSAAVRNRPGVACRVAINRCEHRLDKKRYATGRGFPRARCERVQLSRVFAR